MNLKVYKKACKVALTGACVLVVGAGLAIMAYENSVDHVNEYCKLCDFIGLEHQANAINKDSAINFRTEAVYYQGNADIEKHDVLQEVFKGQHEIDFVNAYRYYSKADINDSSSTVEVFDKEYAVSEDGYIYDYMPSGERVEVYDTDDITAKRLIRIFK